MSVDEKMVDLNISSPIIKLLGMYTQSRDQKMELTKFATGQQLNIMGWL